MGNIARKKLANRRKIERALRHYREIARRIIQKFYHKKK